MDGFTLDLKFITIILQLIFLEGILSFDNAAVLGALVSVLPPDRPVPWPTFLRPLGRLLDPIVGPQRMAALRVGLFGAYAGRALMLVLAAYVIENPWLQLLGALYLIKLAVEHLGAFHKEENSNEDIVVPKQRRGFWSVVVATILMDMAFSLDNVVAAVALSRELYIVLLGVALGMLLMRVAAQLFAAWIEKEPILETAAYLLILNIGIEFLLEEFAHLKFHELTRFAINLTTLILVLIYAHFPLLQQALNTPLSWLARLFYYVDTLLNWIFYPFGLGFRVAWRAGIHAWTGGVRMWNQARGSQQSRG